MIPITVSAAVRLSGCNIFFWLHQLTKPCLVFYVNFISLHTDGLEGEGSEEDDDDELNDLEDEEDEDDSDVQEVIGVNHDSSEGMMGMGHDSSGALDDDDDDEDDDDELDDEDDDEDDDDEDEPGLSALQGEDIEVPFNTIYLYLID